MVGGESLVHENSYVPLHPYLFGDNYPSPMFTSAWQRHKNISLSKKIGGGCHGPAASSRMTPTRPFPSSRYKGTYVSATYIYAYLRLFTAIYGYLRLFPPIYANLRQHKPLPFFLWQQTYPRKNCGQIHREGTTPFTSSPLHPSSTGESPRILLLLVYIFLKLFSKSILLFLLNVFYREPSLYRYG